MIAAVRAVDPEHIISIEGVWRISNLPIASKESWINMPYLVHLYDDTAEFEKPASSIANYAKTRMLKLSGNSQISRALTYVRNTA